MSDAQDSTPAAVPAPATASDAIDQALAQVETPPAAEPAKVEPKADAKPDGEAKPKRDSASDPIARAIRETRQAERERKEAERVRAEAERIRGEVDELAGALSKRDLAKLQEVLEAKGVTFADLVKFNLEADSTKAPEQQLAEQVKQLETKLAEREKAEKDDKAAAERARYEENEREALAAVERLAKSKADDLELVAQEGPGAYRDALVLVDQVWTEAGKPQMSQAEFDEAVLAALSVVEGRIQARLAPLISTKKVKAMLAPPQTQPATKPQETTAREQTSAPATITSTIGSRGVVPQAPARARIPSLEEAIEEAVRAAGAA